MLIILCIAISGLQGLPLNGLETRTYQHRRPLPNHCTGKLLFMWCYKSYFISVCAASSVMILYNFLILKLMKDCSCFYLSSLLKFLTDTFSFY